MNSGRDVLRKVEKQGKTKRINSPKRWGRWEYGVLGVTIIIAGTGIGTVGYLHGCDKDRAIKNVAKKIENDYERSLADWRTEVDSLGVEVDSLEGELAKKDSTFKEETERTSTRHKGEIVALEGRYGREVDATREELERAKKASLDSFLVKYPGFNKDRDYISSIGYWGSKPNKSALDFEDYITLRRSLEFTLEGRDRIVRNVLAGKAIVMSGEVARQKTRDISVRDGEKYIFVADENGNPKGYGMDFDQYEAEIGGKRK